MKTYSEKKPFKIIWSSEARQDLEELYNYYHEKSEKVAADMHDGILEEVVLLADFPLMAPIESMLEGMSKVYRSLVVAKGLFKVVYFTENHHIYITHIWNCRMDPKRLRVSAR